MAVALVAFAAAAVNAPIDPFNPEASEFIDAAVRTTPYRQYRKGGRLRSRGRDAFVSPQEPVHLSLGTLCARLWRGIEDPIMAPGFSLGGIKGKVKLLCVCLANFRQLRSWHCKAQNARFACMVERHPLLPALHTRPYIHAAWSTSEKMEVLQTHYSMLNGAARILHFSPTDSVLLAPLDYIEEDLRLILDKPPWLAQEGEIALNLFSGDTRIYSLLFTLGIRDGKRVAYVGALQGKSGEDALDSYRRLTRASHGMRPRDLLFAAFRMLCGRLSVDSILAISDDGNVARSDYFGISKKMHIRHDPTWIEYGGIVSSGGFFEIAVPIVFRDVKEIPTRKRALYRRRYDMLQQVEAALTASVNVHGESAA